jgi:hypothetical protein
MNCWLQSSDLSSRSLRADTGSVLEAFETHDWLAEDLSMQQLERDGLDSCPAGIGLVRGDGQILHVCPGPGAALVHHHFPARALGFLWRRNLTRTAQNVPLHEVPRLIRIFFSGGNAKLTGAA